MHRVLYILDRREKRKLIPLIALTLIGSAFELIGVTVFMPFIQIIMQPDYMIGNNKYLHWAYTTFHFSSAIGFMIAMCVAIILIYVVKNVFLIWQKKVIYQYSFDVQKHLATKLLNAYMHEPYSFFLQKNIAELQRALQEDVANFSGFIMQFLELAAELVVCILITVYLFTVSKTICIVVAGIMALCIFVFVMVSKKMSTTLGRDCQNYKAKIYQWINQAIGGIKEVKILETDNFFTHSFSSYYDKYSNALCILHLLAMIPKYIVEAVCMTGLLLAIIFKLLWGTADMVYFVPQLTVFAVAAFRLMPSVGRINGYVSQMISSLPSVNLVYHDLEEVDDYQKKQTEVIQKDWKFRNQIAIENVTFHYPGTERRVIDHVSFTIPRGKMIAFIGTSGAGKTTMVDLILGLLSPDSGKICADGMDVHRNPQTWHRELGYIPQSIYLADESIRENIAFGVDTDKIDDEAVNRAIHQAQLDEYISSLPDGVNTMVGDRGVRISGGQRQRIGIARALYHNPEILVLDEATSALDSETESAVMEAINSLQGVKTLIVIAHRLTTIQNADLFYRVEDGKVISQTKEEVFS